MGKGQPKFGASLPSGKEVRYGADVSGSNHLKPVWRFELFDVDGPWGRMLVDSLDMVASIIEKLKNFESMTWADIERDRKRNHDVPTDKMIKKARDRLRELRLDDVGQLFRFRFTGEQRLWGIRDRNTFRILWWDPGHEVCPSVLKHT